MFGGILVMIGLFTRWAAFLSSGQMAAAYFIGHAFSQGVLKVFYPNPFGGNGGELAALYCFVFLFISARGPGIWAVDES